ncbi:MAG: copper uptake system-associated protein [Hyphomicrobiales bacterium]|nr:copper uptake system-associated protein [Hyphomicrobiales bacterium]
MQIFSRFFSGLAIGAALMLAAPAHAHGDADAIRHLMMATFDKPDAPLTVEPVTVFEDIAVAGWSQGDMGGRALLRKKDANWVLTLCSGDALKDATSLQQFGLSAEEAAAMAKAVVDAEAALPASVVAKFATFDGVVMMDGEGHHPPADGHGDHKS